MNSNIPNSPDEHSPSNRGEEQRNGDYNERNNPYFARQQASAEPDLDANEPVLRSSDIKRLNRKALVFLAGIAALLILVIFWLATQSGDDDAPPKPRTETVVAPALPQNMTAPVEEPPVPLAQQPSLPPLPPMPTDEEDEGSSAPERPRGPTLLERRILAEQSANTGAGVPGMPGQPGAQPAAAQDESQVLLAKPISNPDGLMVRGTYIRCILETRIISDFGGYTSCIVTEPVYSINGHNLLLPKGSKMLGQYGAAEPTSRRMQVVWDRVTTPTGLAVRLQRASVLAWVVGLALTGVAYGSIAQDLRDLLGDNQTLEDLISQVGGDLTKSFFATSLLIMALVTGGFAVASTLRLRTEETAGRAEPLLAAALARRRWAASHLVVAGASACDPP